METKTKIMIGAGAVALGAAFLAVPKAAYSASGIDWETVPLPDFLSAPDASDTPESVARSVAEYYNSIQSYFPGFFNSEKHSIDDVLAIWAVESNFNPKAIRKNDGGPGNHAYGIGQVLATTATDFGITNPDAMFDLRTGAAVSMRYMHWAWTYLEARLGREPTKKEWVGSYNAGVGSILKGRNVNAYYFKFWAKRKGLL